MTLLVFVFAFLTTDGSPFDHVFKQTDGTTYQLKITFFNNGLRLDETRSGQEESTTITFLRYADIHRLHINKTDSNTLLIAHTQGEHKIALRDVQNAETLMKWISGMISDGPGLPHK